MTTIGAWSLPAAIALALYAVLCSIIGQRRRSPGLIQSGENAVVGATFFVTLAVAAVVTAIHRNDFSLAFVFMHSSRELPALYKWTALWGGMEGSLLFWVWILCLYSTFVVLQGKRGVERLMPYAVSTLMVIALFFLGVIQFLENPFEKVPFPAANGRGLNPLLQDPGMAFHPPCLYLGFIGTSVPYAFAMAALITGRLDTVWIQRTRKWALGAWLFLMLGNLLGAWWAYHVLGWGGYWGWDPVENSAFLPWLVLTAYIHSIQIEQHRGMLRSWNMLLIIFAWLLTIIGTFLTRSGVITSVHSFAEGPIGAYFLGFILVATVVSTALVVYRAPLLRSRERFSSLWSREVAFLLNNLLLVFGAFSVLFGVLFPILSEAATGSKISLGAPFFLRIMIPIGLATLVLMGVGPLIAWRRATSHNFRRNFVWPTALALIAAAALFAFLEVRRIEFVAAFAFGVFVLVGIAIEFYRGIRVRARMARENPAVAGIRLVAGSRRRFGGYIVHVGVVIVFIGFAGSVFNRKLEADVRRGESAHLAGYDFVFEELNEDTNPSYDSLTATMLLRKGDRAIARMYPEFRFFHTAEEQRHTRVAIYSTVARDFYVFLAGFDGERLSVNLHVNPLVSWVWGGGIVAVAGLLICVWPDRRRVRAALGAYGEELLSAGRVASG
jgi:cytochrome c-type biogenesis protein CcmF